MAEKEENKIRNIGPKSAAWLRQVGIKNRADLEQTGPVEAFLKIKRAGFKPSLNLLYALAGALENCHWSRLPHERKSTLLLSIDAALAANPIKTRWQTSATAGSVHSSQQNEESDNSDISLLDVVDEPTTE